MEAAHAQHLLAGMADWRRSYDRGGIRVRGPKLKSGEFYAARVPYVGVALLGPGAPTRATSVHGEALASNDRLILARDQRTVLQAWGWETVTALRPLPNWGGVVVILGAQSSAPFQALVLNHLPAPGEDAASVRRIQRTGWLEIEATFAAVQGQLARFFTTLPARLATLDAP